MAAYSPPFVAAQTVRYRPRINCDTVITPKHEVIIRFFPVTA